MILTRTLTRPSRRQLLTAIDTLTVARDRAEGATRAQRAAMVAQLHDQADRYETYAQGLNPHTVGRLVWGNAAAELRGMAERLDKETT